MSNVFRIVNIIDRQFYATFQREVHQFSRVMK